MNSHEPIQAIRNFLKDDESYRPHCKNCKTCQRFSSYKRGRRIIFHCDELCKDAVKVFADCGATAYSYLIPYAREWEPND